MSGATTTIGGSITYASGNGPDQVQLDNTIVGKNATFNLGSGGDIATPQFLNLGTTSTSPVEVAGTLTIKGGADNDSIDIARTRIGGALSLKTLGGDDTVKIDDTDVAGATSIDLGTGTDSLLIETRATDDVLHIALPLNTRFGSAFKVYGGAGDDTVTLGVLAINPVDFGGPVKLIGGAGLLDTLSANPANTYLQLPFEDFEIGTF